MSASATPAVRAKPLVLAYRGPVLENVFFGHAVAYDVHGRRHFSLGNTARLTPVRSCLKPFQALPLLMEELPPHQQPSEQEVALMCGSHAAEPVHLGTVRSILKKAGANEGALGCGAPEGRRARIYNNCSGKHSGMLLYCSVKNLPIEGYLDPGHPLQDRIITEVLKLSRSVRPEVPIQVDGCGAPVPALPLEKIAWLFAQLSRPTGLPAAMAAGLQRAASAMREHPLMVAGTGHFDTRISEITSGRILAKCGADGLSCLSDRETGTGIAVKCESPSIAMAQGAALGLARKLNMVDDAEFDTLVSEFLPPRLNTNGLQIGTLRLASEIC